MQEENPIRIADIGHMNPKTRLEGENLVREFEGIVVLFNRVLQFKERERLILEARVKDLDRKIEDNQSKLKVLEINLSIYDQNDDKISSAFTDLDYQEKKVKDVYETMLTGKSPLEGVVELEHGKIPLQKQVMFDVEEKLIKRYSENFSGRDGLIQRRRRYLEDLDSTFKKFDEELFQIDGVRNNLKNARTEIQHKKDKALNARTALESSFNSLNQEKNEVKVRLEESLIEESFVLNEYRELLRPISGHLEIRPQTDQILMNLNSAAETDVDSISNTKAESKKGRLKVLDNPLRATGA
tara:strand:+ start:570 stop:1463 length:894 start_codon:yes stop_codon:yes gene_type:complete